MTSPNTPGSVPPPPPPPQDPTTGPGQAGARHVPSNDDIPTAPFQAVPAAAATPAPTHHAPVPPPPDAVPPRRISSTPQAPTAPVRPPPVPRVSAAQRRTTPPASPYAAAAPQPARPMPRGGFPLQQVSAPDAGDWFGETAAAQEAAPTYAPQYGQQGYAQPYPPAGPYAAAPQAAQQYPPAAYPQAAGYAPADGTPGYAQAEPAYAEAAYGEPPAPARKRLSPGWIAFIALDVVLVVALVVFAVNMLGGRGNADQADDGPTAASTQDVTPTDEATPAPPEVLAEFASPSGNIVCAITSADVTCSIAQLNQQPAPVEGCEGTVGYRVTLSAETGEVSLPCVPADAQPKPAEPSTQKLEYTQSVTQGQFTCTSADTGMSCKDDTTGKGFSIAKAGIGTF